MLLMAIFSLSLKMWVIITLWFILAPVAHRWNLGPLYVSCFYLLVHSCSTLGFMCFFLLMIDFLLIYIEEEEEVFVWHFKGAFSYKICFLNTVFTSISVLQKTREHLENVFICIERTKNIFQFKNMGLFLIATVFYIDSNIFKLKCIIKQ